MRNLILLTLALLLSCGPALADTPIERSHSLDADGTVSIANVSGEVTVTGWDRPEVRITGSLGQGAKPLTVEGDSHHLKIKVEAKRSGGWFNWSNKSKMKPTTLKILVPMGAAINVDIVSADTRLDNLTGGKISVDSISGQVSVKADSPEISVNSVSGKVTLGGKLAHLNINTVSGDVHAPMVGERGKLESVSGDITVGGGPFEHLNVSTVSGDLDIRGDLAPSGKMTIDTMSGDVNVMLPKSVSAHIDASTFSGDIASELGQPTNTRHGSGDQLSARMGAGDGSISLQSFSGNIRIQLSPAGKILIGVGKG